MLPLAPCRTAYTSFRLPLGKALAVKRQMELINRYKEKYSGTYAGPASPSEVDSLLSELGISDQVYREWLVATGGGPIGSEWFDEVQELLPSQEKCASEKWSISGAVIGWDGAGNPIAIQENGKILVEDHNFGGVHVFAESFEAYLGKCVNS